MEYSFTKINDQNLAFRIETTNNGESISFNVVCAQDESEIPALVELHLSFLNNPPSIPSEAPHAVDAKDAQISSLQSDVAALIARIEALENLG